MSALSNLAAIEIERGNPAAALLNAMEAVRAAGDTAMLGNCQCTLGLIAIEAGDPVEALRHTSASSRTRLDLGDRLGLVYTVELFAAVAAMVGKPQEAVTLAAAGAAWRERLGTPRPPAWGGPWRRSAASKPACRLSRSSAYARRAAAAQSSESGYTPPEHRGYMAMTVATSPGERPSRWPMVTLGSMGVMVSLPFLLNAQDG